MKRTLFLWLAAGLAMSSAAFAAAPRANKAEMRITLQRVTRLATVGGQKLTKAERKQITVAAHVEYAILAYARAEGVKATNAEIDRQLREWNLSAAAGDPREARSYDAQEQALALRDVAEARVLFVKLAKKAGSPQKAYGAIIEEHVAQLPNVSFSIKDLGKMVPGLLGAAGGSTAFLGGGSRRAAPGTEPPATGSDRGSGGESESSGGASPRGDAMSLLGQALAPKPGPLARTLEKTVSQFDGNPDHLPLIYPNSARER
jgi:hypothetical protein